MILRYMFLGGSRLGHLDGALQPAYCRPPPWMYRIGPPCQLVPMIGYRERVTCARHEEAVSAGDQAPDVVCICVRYARQEVFLTHLENSVAGIRRDRNGPSDSDASLESQFVAVCPTRLDTPQGECYISFDPVPKILGALHNPTFYRDLQHGHFRVVTHRRGSHSSVRVSPEDCLQQLGLVRRCRRVHAIRTAASIQADRPHRNRSGAIAGDSQQK